MFLKVKDRYSAKTTLINKDNIIYKLFITYFEDDLNLSKKNQKGVVRNSISCIFGCFYSRFSRFPYAKNITLRPYHT